MLSIEDRMAIQDLYARYNAYFDLGDAERWAQCFTDDGEFAFHKVRGRAALAEWCRQRVARRPDEPWLNVQHWNNNLVVEGGLEKARGMCYVMRLGKERTGGALVVLTPAMYLDELVRVGATWLFSRRDAVLDTPPSSAIPMQV